MENIIFLVPVLKWVWIVISENFFRKVGDLIFFLHIKLVEYSFITNQVHLVNRENICILVIFVSQRKKLWVVDSFMQRESFQILRWKLVLENIKDISWITSNFNRLPWSINYRYLSLKTIKVFFLQALNPCC